MDRDDDATALSDLLREARVEQRDPTARLLRAKLRAAVLDVPLEPPLLGRFAVLGVLGRGAQGTVLMAFDPLLDRKVAIKVLHAGDAPTRSRMLVEARALARVTHPHVVAIHEAGESDGDVYLVMQLVEGVTLPRWLQAGPRARDTVVGVLAAIAEGLAAAHAAGVIHGDVKPDNVLVDARGQAWLADLGMARILGEDDGRSGGTDGYLAPERRDGGPASAAADQYALAVTMHEALTGVRPEDAGETRTRDRTGRRVLRAVSRALATDPRDRFIDMSAFVAALAAARARPQIGRGIAVAALVAIALGTRALVPTPPGCDAAADGITTVWNDARRAELAASLAAIEPRPAPDVVDPLLTAIDRRVHEHAALAREVCEATRVRAQQSDSRYDARMRCLQRRADELAAFVDALEHAGEAKAVAAAFDGISALVELDRCSRDDLDGAAPPADLVDAIAETRADIDRGWADFHLARYASARGHAAAAEQAAAIIGHAPLVLESLLLVGAAEGRDGDATRAEAVLARAIVLAGELHLDLEGADAAMALLRARMFAGRRDQVESAADFVRAALVRAARPAAQVDGIVGEARLHAGAAADALEPLRTALSGETDPPRVAILHTLIGSAELELGDHARALHEYREALAIARAHYGAEHPSVGFFVQRLGRGQRAAGAIDDALATLTAALALREASLGPDDRAVASALVDLADAEMAAARWSAARDHLLRALSIREIAYGPEHPQVAEAHLRIAEVLERTGESDAARRHYRAALAIRTRHDPDHPDVARIGTALVRLDAPRPP